MRILYLIIFLFLFQLTGNTQNRKYYFHEQTNATLKAKDGKTSLSVYSLEYNNNTITVIMRVKFHEDISTVQLHPPTTTEPCYLSIGNKKIKCEYWRVIGNIINGKEYFHISDKAPNLKTHNCKLNEAFDYELTFKGTLPINETSFYLEHPGRISYNGMFWRFKYGKLDLARKHYTNYSSEYSIKQHLDANNDGICGIYEVMGDDAGSKFACIKHNGEYALIFISDNLGRNWWEMGDIKAYLRRSASGIYKADWFMSDKSLNKDCYISFDGVSMTVNLVSGISEPGETKYLKMYPTTPPSYNNNQRDYTPQRQQQTPQRNRTIPVLKKQNVKK